MDPYGSARPRQKRRRFRYFELSKEVLGPEHPDSFAALSALSTAWEEQKRCTEAEAAAEVHAFRKEFFGWKHHDTLMAATHLASNWHNLGQYDRAEEMEMETLELKKEIFGLSHRETLWAMRDLARTWHEQSKLEEALSFLTEAGELGKETLGTKHPATESITKDVAVWQTERECAEAKNKNDGDKSALVEGQATSLLKPNDLYSNPRVTE